MGRKVKRVQGVVVDDPMPPIARKQSRIKEWLLKGDRAEVVFSLPVIAALAFGFHLWRWSFLAFFFAVCFAFVLGWNLAARHVRKHGYVDSI